MDRHDTVHSVLPEPHHLEACEPMVPAFEWVATAQHAYS